jgi:hypothetical protein
MTSLFKKLNFKNHSLILSLNHPKSFEPELQNMRLYANVSGDFNPAQSYSFVLIFVSTLEEIEKYATLVVPTLEPDACFWFVYPKGTSKKYKCEFNRDNGWTNLSKLGYETVRMVAIDEDWSALRFRKTEYVKSKAIRKSLV